jgi:hypothetical protein
MATFTRGDMQYSYQWTARPEDNPNFRRGSDYRNFNRNEGYEVLFVINEFLDLKGLKSVPSGQKAEKLIHDKLPSRVFTHRELYRWLNENW